MTITVAPMTTEEQSGDRKCALLAEMQHGVIHRCQALAAGLTETQVAGRLARRDWIVIHPDTYRVAGAPVTRSMLIMAAWMWGQDCFVSHVTAAELWNLDGIPGQEDVEITAYAGKNRPGVIVHRLRPNDRPPIRVLDGMAVASIERTLFELSGKLPMRHAGLALDDALRRRLTTLDRCWEAWQTFGRRGRKGTKAFKTLLFVRDDREGLLKSRLEKKMLLVLKQLHPPAVPNHRVTDGSRVAYLDFAYPTLKLGIETHGAQWHHGEERWKKDLARDRWLKGLGWIVLYFSWDDVHLAPTDVRTEIQTFLDRLRLAG